MSQTSGTVDLRELWLALRRNWYLPMAGALVGALVAALVIFTVSPRYKAVASVLLRNLSAYEVTSGAGLAPSTAGAGGLADVLSLDPGFDTEVAILTSRAVIGEVVRTLGLQAELSGATELPLDSILSANRFEEVLVEGRYRFERSEGGYRVRGPTGAYQVGQGDPMRLPGALLTLRDGNLPDQFEITLYDFQEAVERTRKALSVGRAGGSLAELTYVSRDRIRASRVPNAVIDAYLTRRRTTDRGISQRRYEFLREQADSISTELAVASRQLTEHQQRSGLLSPDARAEAEVLQAMELRARGQELAVEARSLEQTLGRVGDTPRDAREVASYPVLLSNPAVNQLLSRLSDLQAEQSLLLERRTEEDPDVELLAREIGRVEGEIHRIARSYQIAVGEQLTEVRAELAAMDVNLESLPEQVELSFHLQRDVERLSAVLTGIQGDLVRTRLAAIAEGGDVRQVDIAEIPREPSFPIPMLVLALGVLGGGFFGTVGALVQPAFGRRVRSVPQLERMIAADVVRLEPDAPLLIKGLDGASALLVLPGGKGGNSLAVAERLAQTAALRARKVVLMEWSEGAADETPAIPGDWSVRGESNSLSPVPPPSETGAYVIWKGNGGGPAAARSAMQDVEGSETLIVAALPGIDRAITTALLESRRPVVLVVRANVTSCDELMKVVETLERVGLVLEAVVLQETPVVT